MRAAHRLCRAVPQRSAFHRGALPDPDPGRARARKLGRSSRRSATDVTYVKPGDHVITCLSVFCGTCPQCVTGHPNLCENTDVKMMPGQARRMTWKGGQQMNQAFNLSSFGEQMLVHENVDGEDRRRHPARPRGAGRLRRDDRGRRGVQRRQGRAGRDGRGDRLRRGRAVGGQRRGARRRRADHRDRHGAVEARAGARARRHRHAQRQQRRSGRAGPRDDQGRRALFVRGARHQEHRRAGLSDAAPGRHRDDHRHGAVRHQDRAARLRFPARPQDPGHLDGRQPLPGRHAAPVVAVAPGPAEARSSDLGHASSSTRSTRVSPG